MVAEILAWGFIAAVYIAAVGVITLPKHWYRFAQFLFSVASLLAYLKMTHWAITSPHSLTMRIVCLSLGVVTATGALIWFLHKVEGDIRRAKGETKRDYLISRLTGFIKEASKLDEGHPLYLANFEFGVGAKIGRFLRLNLPEELPRFEDKGIDAVDEIISELLDGERVKTKLTISFVPDNVPNESPFCEEFQGDDGDVWTLYRIEITSSAAATIWVKIKKAVLDGHSRANVHLHRMYAEHRVVRVEMSANHPEYWDIAEKGSRMDYAHLTHVEPLPRNLPTGEQRLEIVASVRDGSVFRKLAVLTVDKNKKLNLELHEVS